MHQYLGDVTIVLSHDIEKEIGVSITRINEFEAAAGKADELHTFLGSILPYITSSPGSLACEILRKVDNQDAFVVNEQ